MKKIKYPMFEKEIKVICPICNFSSTVFLKEKKGIVNKYFYQCSHCGLDGPLGVSKNKALELWNNGKSKKYCLFCGGELINCRCKKCHAVFTEVKDNSPRLCCCYIDVLGFSNVSKNTIDAMRVISNFENIYEKKDIGETGNFSSFYHFLPFSDSVFICSKEPNSFVLDLSKFISESFTLTSIYYIYPEDPSNPQVVTVPVIRATNQGVTTENRQENWFPTLFKGGISFGEIKEIEQSSTFFNKQEIRSNLMGKALTASVDIGEKLRFHGARIICDSNFYNQLNPEIQKKFFDEIYYKNEVYYELLWPLINFLDANIHCGIDMVIVNGLNDLLTPMISFYKCYSTNVKLEKVYFNTLKMFLRCVEKYLDIFKADEKEKNISLSRFKRILEMHQLNNLFDELKNNDYKDSEESNT